MASLERQRWLRFGWNTARYALGPIGGVLVPLIVVRRSDISGWGEAMLVIIPMQIFLHVAAWGNREFLLRQFASTGTEPRVLATSNFLTRAILMLPIAALLGIYGTRVWMIAALWFFASFCASAFDPVLIWRKRFSTLLLADLAGLVVQATFLLASHLPDSGTVLISFLLNSITRLGIVAIIVRSWPTLEHPIDAFVISFKEHILGAFPFFLIGFSGLLASRVDLYTANALLDRADTGRYQIIASLFIQFQALASLVVAPLTRDLYRLNAASVSLYVRRMRTWAMLGLLPMCAVAWAAFNFLFRFSPHWSVYVAACALVWPVFAYVPFMNQLYKHGRERSVLWANFTAATISCALTMLLLPRFGITGGLLAGATGQWLMLAWIALEHRRLHALPGM